MQGKENDKSKLSQWREKAKPRSKEIGALKSETKKFCCPHCAKAYKQHKLTIQ